MSQDMRPFYTSSPSTHRGIDRGFETLGGDGTVRSTRGDRPVGSSHPGHRGFEGGLEAGLDPSHDPDFAHPNFNDTDRDRPSPNLGPELEIPGSMAPSPHTSGLEGASNPRKSGLGSRRSQGFSVDAYADTLMNDLFGEVEHILDTGAAPPRADEQPEFIAIKPLPVKQIQFPSALVPRMDPYSPVDGDGVIEAEIMGAGELPLLDRGLMAAVVVALGLTLGLWVLDRDRYAPLMASLTGTPPAATVDPASIPLDPQAEAQQQFIAYLERSLELLEEKETALAEAPTPPAPGAPGTLPPGTPLASATLPTQPLATLPPGTTLPTVPVPGSIPGQTVLPPVGLANPNPTTVLERVYIPIYTPGAPGTAAVAPIPGLTLNPPAGAGLPPMPGNGAPLASALGASTPQNPNPGTAGSSPSTTAVAPLPVPSATHTLMGILELGDRSAALFEINGVTRRIHLGEAIGSSGWTLVEVANQEAIMRRNGEVRSVYVGQAF